MGPPLFIAGGQLDLLHIEELQDGSGLGRARARVGVAPARDGQGASVEALGAGQTGGLDEVSELHGPGQD